MLSVLVFLPACLIGKVLLEKGWPFMVKDEHKSSVIGGYYVESVQLAVRDDKVTFAVVAMVDYKLVEG